MAITLQTGKSKKELFESGNSFKIGGYIYFLNVNDFKVALLNMRNLDICEYYDYGNRSEEVFHAKLDSVQEDGFIAFRKFFDGWARKKVLFSDCIFISNDE